MEALTCHILSPLKMPETELKMVPELYTDKGDLDAHGIQSSSLITKNPSDS